MMKPASEAVAAKKESSVVLVMGVAGCGKSTFGSELARVLGAAFLDGDDFHPLENKAKMAASVPLTDEDRAGWLAALRERLDGNVVLACSALKRSYRATLLQHLGGRRYVVLLHGRREVLEQRLRNRHGHFAGVGLLESQLQTLEEPADDELEGVKVIRVDIEQSTDEQVAKVVWEM